MIGRWFRFFACLLVGGGGGFWAFRHYGLAIGTVGGATAWLDAEGNLIAVGRIDEVGIGRVLRGFAVTSPI